MEYKLPEVLKELLNKYDMTQTELATKLEVGNDTVCRWIKDRHMPQLALVMQIAEFFGVSIDYLVYGKDGGRWSD